MQAATLFAEPDKTLALTDVWALYGPRWWSALHAFYAQDTIAFNIDAIADQEGAGEGSGTLLGGGLATRQRCRAPIEFRVVRNGVCAQVNVHGVHAIIEGTEETNAAADFRRRGNFFLPD